MKKGVKIFLIVFILLLVVVAGLVVIGFVSSQWKGPQDEQGLSYRLSDDETHYIVYCNGDCEHTEIVVPATFEGLPVSEIREESAFWCENLTSLIFAEDSPIEELGTVSFDADSIPAGSFLTSNNSGLEKVVLPSGLKKLGDGAFAGCTQLTTIELPEGLEMIGKGAFNRCANLISITIPSSVQRIGGRCFEYSDKLLEVYNLSNVELREYTEESMDRHSLTTDAIIHASKDEPSVLSRENGFVFCNVEDVRYLISYEGNSPAPVLPNGDYQLFKYAFAHQKELTSIVIPDFVVCIPDYAFLGCNKLTSITIPEGVAEISSNAFQACSSVFEEVDGVSYVDKWAVSCIEGLTSIKLRAGTVGVADCAFSQADRTLKSIQFPASVKYLGERLVTNTTLTTHPLKEVTFDAVSSLERISEQAFYACENLESITIPASVKFIGSSAFGSCTSLEQVFFDQKFGWKMTHRGYAGSVEETEVAAEDLFDSKKAAEYLTTEYMGREWHCN